MKKQHVQGLWQNKTSQLKENVQMQHVHQSEYLEHGKRKFTSVSPSQNSNAHNGQNSLKQSVFQFLLKVFQDITYYIFFSMTRVAKPSIEEGGCGLFFREYSQINYM